MHVGDHWQLALPSNIALGAKGAANGAIPPDQTLLFDLTLISTVAARAGTVGGRKSLFGLEQRPREAAPVFTIRP